MGGIDPASTYISTALQAGRQVITANKQLVAAQGPSLACLGPLRFEASVASAIPIVETLADTLAADRIGSIMGIINGTTNSILAAMAGGGRLADALAEAPRRGLGQAHPSADGRGPRPAAPASAVLADLIRAAKDMPASAGSLLATLVDAPPATVFPLGPTAQYPAAS